MRTLGWNPFDTHRPEGLNYVETTIWEGAAEAAAAAYNRLVSDPSLSLEVADALAIEDARQAAGPHVVKLVRNPDVFDVLRSALALNGAECARRLIAQPVVGSVPGGGFQ